MSYGIRIVALGHTLIPGEPWVRSFVHDTPDGIGRIAVSIEPKDALVFATKDDAWEFIFRESTVRPLRDEGLPNRPLRAYSTEIAPLP